MANKILIKRSTANAVVTGLSNGELAFTQAGSKLFIGAPDGSGVIAIGGAHNPGVLTANQALVANSTSGIDKIIVANAAVTAVYANGSVGTDGQFLTSNGSVVFWSTATTTTNLTYSSNATTVTIASSTGDNAIILAANSTIAGVISAADQSKLDGIAANAQPGTVTSVATGNGLSGGPITTTGTISVVANNGLSANATGIYVVGGNGLISNTTGVHVGAANGISVTADAVGLTTGSTLTVNTSGVHVNTSLSITDLTLSGNLVVNGTLTTIDTDNLSVEDSLIQIARNNTSTDSLDIGVYVSFGATGA